MEKKFASRAGEKLEFALKIFQVSVDALTCLDLGSSTGGFTDCLLQNGALRVYSVDTSYGELAWRLRNDPRVVVLERTNALHVKLPEKVDFISIDVSWTKQKLILPYALTLLKPDGLILSLLKPHYEAEEHQLVKGRVKDEFVEEVVNKTIVELNGLGVVVSSIIESPIWGEKGKNKEFLLLVKGKG